MKFQTIGQVNRLQEIHGLGEIFINCYIIVVQLLSRFFYDDGNEF